MKLEPCRVCGDKPRRRISDDGPEVACCKKTHSNVAYGETTEEAVELWNTINPSIGGPRECK